MRRPSSGGTFGAVELRSRLSAASPPRVDVLVALAFVALGALESVFSETTLPPLRTPRSRSPFWRRWPCAACSRSRSRSLSSPRTSQRIRPAVLDAARARGRRRSVRTLGPDRLGHDHDRALRGLRLRARAERADLSADKELPHPGRRARAWRYHPFQVRPWRRGAIAQLEERLDRTQEVAGSSPASSISGRCCTAVPSRLVGSGDAAMSCATSRGRLSALSTRLVGFSPRLSCTSVRATA
jgi:hypothetical protein